MTRARLLSVASAALWIVAIAARASGRQVELSWRVAVPDTRCAISGVATFDHGGRPSEIPVKERVVEGEGSEPIAIADEAVEVTVTSSDCWAERVRLDSGTAAAVSLWPAAVIIGEFRISTERQAPRIIEAAFADAGSERTNPREHPVQCALGALAWRCRIPARRPMHIRVSADDFAPVYLWDIEAREPVVNAGEHELLRGAGIVGRVVTDRGAPIENASISLVTVGSAHQSATDRELARYRTRSDARGYFQFVGVTSGRYRVISKSGGRGDATREIEVTRGQDLRIAEDLTHAAMAELEIWIDPPVSRQGRAWRVLLTRDSTRLHERVPVAEGMAGPNGMWAQKDLQPASYVLTVFDAQSEVARQSIDLKGGPERIPIAISVIQVRGKIEIGGKAVPGTIQFDRDGYRVNATVNDAGAFEAAFPKAGNWLPTFVRKGQRSEIRLPAVDVRSPHDEELILRIPGGRIHGKVLAQDGRPTPAAVIVRRDRRIAAQCLTDDDGSFELLGIEAASYTIEANTEDAYAGPLGIDVREKETFELELRVESLREVTGHVMTSDGMPASGAIVRSVDPITGSYEDGIADGRGIYSFRVKPQSGFVDIIVMAPPHPIAIRRFSIPDRRNGSLPAIRLAAFGATLRLHILRVPPWPVLTMPDGRPYSMALLLAPRFGGGGPRREFVNGGFEFLIDPGTYRVCDASAECRTAHLATHAVTVVDFTGQIEGGAS